MKAHTRRAIAFIAARAVNDDQRSSVYDYEERRYISFSGKFNGRSISAYDYDRRCHISGTLPSLYDYGDSQHIQLKVNGQSFTGYDYGTSQHFSGNVNGHSISLYDFATGTHYNYTS